MSDDKVIHAFQSRDLPECPVSIAHRIRACGHPAINLNLHDRQLSCAKCGAVLDAFDYLVAEAEAIRRGWENYRYVQRMVDERRAQLADLDKEKRRLQGQVRRLSLRENKD